jgi:hypothetical protein
MVNLETNTMTILLTATSHRNICYGEVMFAFLWTELGATDKEILEKLKKGFE